MSEQYEDFMNPPPPESAYNGRHGAYSVGSLVHNHGTEDGPGLACPTRMVDGKLRGECMNYPVVPVIGARVSPDVWDDVWGCGEKITITLRPAEPSITIDGVDIYRAVDYGTPPHGGTND